MAQTDTTAEAADAEPSTELESNTYEVIQNRLRNSANDLRGRLDQLNDARKEVFGSIDTALTGTERITTEHNCVPRDMVAIGDHFLFGYNVTFGLKSDISLADVFAVYQFAEGTFHTQPLTLIDDAAFRKDFHDVYRYYKSAVFAKFMLRGPNLYMIFRVGKSEKDIKAFKWVVQGDRLTYLDSRSDHEVRFPEQHAFDWKRTHRDLHQSGMHPHISIDDRLFVETVGGDLTVKIENNTESGEGIYAEPVDDVDQTLDDAEIFYAIVGNLILLKIRPYQEKRFRYLVYSEKIQKAMRLDSIEHACVLLPDDHGLIFSNGYYLQSGESKTFESGLTDMLFERQLVAPNGEDYLYIFYNRSSGTYVLLQYNLIEQHVETPLVCHGFTFFEGGELVCFKCQDDPQKHHTVQVWQTPYVGEDYVPHTQSDSYLNKIGNRDIVRGMSECHEIINLINKDDSYANLYVDLVKLSSDVVDSYFWIDREETFDLKSALVDIRAAATSAVDEFDKVVRVRRNTSEQTSRVAKEAREIIATVNHRRFAEINEFVTSLSDLRKIRGEIISLRDLRYVDESLVEALETQVGEESDRLAKRCVEFLLKPDALQPYVDGVEAEQAKVDGLTKVTDANAVEQQIATSAGELEMLIEIVSNLKIDDATHRTTIIDNISEIFSTVNQARAALKKKTRELLSVEGVAEFGSQMKLLSQGVVNYLDISDTPEKCEEFLTKLMVQIEELEGRFAEFDEFVLQLTEKREEIYNAFESRKLSLVEARNKRAVALAGAADRILKGIKSRVESFDSINDINGYFASDLMIEKVRDIVGQLEDLDDSVKVDDIQSRMKAIREDAVRQLKDRQELYVDGANIIRFGVHQFSVNVQTLDLTTVIHDDEMCLHLTGTNFIEPITDVRLAETRDSWDQEVVSENRGVYRGEYLAYLLLRSLQAGDDTTIEQAVAFDDEQLPAWVQKAMAPRYTEGYVKGVHDHDAACFLRHLVQMDASIGLLRYHTKARALASIYWQHFVEKKDKTRMAARLAGYGAVSGVFPDTGMQSEYVDELRTMLANFVRETKLFDEAFVDEAAEYLFLETTQNEGFAESGIAQLIFREFQTYLERHSAMKPFEESVKHVHRDPVGWLILLREWIGAYLAASGEGVDADFIDEAASILMRGRLSAKRLIDAEVACVIEGLLGTHPAVEGEAYALNYNGFLARLSQFERQAVPRFEAYTQLKRDIVDAARDEMRLDEFRPRVLTSFVRNKLLDTVYLPLIGDNLAKQIGTSGEGKRTDRMGLLLLVSPPGYGKTTLMEYIANRLGIIFMKINGPAIGHEVTSLDPAAAPNAGAREEVEKLNLAFEMGDNVMIYLDDIQHCNPELLQKFISLCDAQRKIEGVYKGQTRTYDFRGRKVAVVMAGNPYTESGEKFQIPDMLTNRADIYNLGEIIGENAPAFEMSYLENSLTSNPALSKLASRSQADVYAIIRMAEDPKAEGIDLEGNYSVEELGELVGTMQKLMRVRDVILAVNQEYIRSAAQSDDYRTEPAFKLQGSYRNMNRIAEKVLPILNDDELQALIVSNYQNDSQTLTSDTEANLLKFKELIGILTDEEQQRWDAIRRTFRQNVKMRGIAPDDKVGQVIAQLSTFSDGLDAIRGTLDSGISGVLAHQEELAAAAAQAAEATAEEAAATADEQQAVAPGAEEIAITEHMGELLSQFAGLKSGLEGIGRTLSGGLDQVADIAEKMAERPIQVSAPVALPEAAPAAAMPEGVSEHLVKPEEQGDLSKITVVNKIPASVLDVMEQQFKLMHGWMEPILKQSQSHSAEILQLRELVADCLNDYRKLIGRMRVGRSQDEVED